MTKPQDISTAPKNGDVIQVEYLMVGIYRWKPYKPESQQFKRGIAGRWQAHDGYGWNNAELPDNGAWEKVPLGGSR